MNETALIVPIPPESTAVTGLILSRKEYSLATLARMSTEELHQLRRRWYDEAHDAGIILMLRLIVQGLGQCVRAGRCEWKQEIEDLKIEASIEADVLEMSVNSNLVCSESIAGEEIFVPGTWLKTLLYQFERIEVLKQRAAQKAETKQKEDLIHVLAADV